MTELKNLNAEFPDIDIDGDEGTWFDSEEEEIELEEEEITEPFDPTQIRVDTRPMTIDLVLKRIEYDEIDLAPEFQRHADIWTNTAKSRLIESILIRIPLPAFYMDATNEDKWLVIDGLQRLSTIKKFVIDQKLRLVGLEFLTSLTGKTYDELPRNYQRRIDETVLTVYLIEKGTPPEVKFNIFRRINTGGEPLSPQELRHALNPGQATRFLDKLAKSKEFWRVENLSDKRKKRMEDHEFILGFLAFTLTSYKNYPIKKGRDYFLNEAMIKINKLTSQELNILESQFIRAMNTAFTIFGKYAFRKMSNKHTKKYPINKALFEAWSVNITKLNRQEIDILQQRRENLIDKFIYYIDNDDEFVRSISQAANKIQYRFTTIEKIIQEVLS